MSKSHLTSEGKRNLTKLFRKFNNNGVNYVILRGYQDLPDSYRGDDIDVFVEESDYDRSIKISNQLGWNRGKSDKKLGRYTKILKQGVKKPDKALKFLKKNRYRTISEVNSYVETGSLRGQLSQVKVRNNDLKIHLQNHITYKSPSTAQRIRVDPTVEELMLDRRVQEPVFCYTPSLVDEIVHLVCRGIFDKDGDFPDYYINRLDNLLRTLDKESIQELKNLLPYIFYNADNLVFDSIMDREFKDL